MLGMGWTVVIGKVQRHIVIDLDNEEGSVWRRRWQTQDLSQERRRLALVARLDNRVVQSNRQLRTPIG